MEFLLSSYTDAFIITSSFFLLILTLLWFSSNGTKKKKLPPHAGGAWPIIGHLHLLGGPQPAHIVLGNMADRYGPIFTIKMGVHRTLVVNSSEMAKECLTTNDRAFASRPKTLAVEILGYNRAMLGFSEYGPYWRHIRKFSTVELLSSSRLQTLRSFRETEVRAAARELHKLWQEKNKVFVEMDKWIGDITLNVILRLVVGKSVGYGREVSWKRALKRFFDYSGRFLVSDGLPFLRFLDIGGSEKEMKKVAKELDEVVEVWIKEHKEKRMEHPSMEGGEDFMGLMLSLLDEEFPGGHDPNTINKATCLGLILAASDTTSITLTWVLSLLVNHPSVLKKVQDELDLHVGKERQVQESDLHNMVYLQAIIQETLRLYPAAPLSVPHESLEDCTVAGYHIPAKTRLIVNIRKILRDPKDWSDPEAFQPERFLTTHKDTDFRGKNFEFIPFGSGRRMCPGISFAQHVMQLTLAMLLQGFDFGTKSGEPVDMIESIGLTNPRATPLVLSLSPRLPSHLYT